MLGQLKKFQSPRIRRIDNNMRFMILSAAQGCWHLDSHVLGTNLQLLSSDWQAE